MRRSTRPLHPTPGRLLPCSALSLPGLCSCRLKQAQINQAQGEATAIRVLAEANAAGVRAVAEAISDKGGMDAANLKVAQQYVDAFASLAKSSNTMIIPANAGDVAGFIGTAMSVLERVRQGSAGVRS